MEAGQKIPNAIDTELERKRKQTLDRRRQIVELTLGDLFVSWAPSIDGIILKGPDGGDVTLTAEMLEDL